MPTVTPSPHPTNTPTPTQTPTHTPTLEACGEISIVPSPTSFEMPKSGNIFSLGFYTNHFDMQVTSSFISDDKHYRFLIFNPSDPYSIGGVLLQQFNASYDTWTPASENRADGFNWVTLEDARGCTIILVDPTL